GSPAATAVAPGLTALPPDLTIERMLRVLPIGHARPIPSGRIPQGSAASPFACDILSANRRIAWAGRTHSARRESPSMAASNDSQGLKIAVAVFIALSVILAVTSYFLYSNGSAAEARLATQTEKTNNAEKAQRIQQAQIEDLRGRIGVRTEE